VPGVISAGARLRSRGAGRRSQAPCTQRSESTATRAPSSAHTSHRATMPAPAPSSWWTEPATLRARSALKRPRQRARSSLCTPQVHAAPLATRRAPRVALRRRPRRRPPARGPDRGAAVLSLTLLGLDAHRARQRAAECSRAGQALKKSAQYAETITSGGLSTARQPGPDAPGLRVHTLVCDVQTDQR
jgi:hypothetical protein